MRLSILIPVYNEESFIQEIVRQVQQVPYDKEIVIVNDGSTDRTREELEKLKDSNIKVIHHEKNQGKGAGVRTALKNATGDIILIQDADLEYSPKDYPVLLQPLLDNRADVVFGSRFLGGPKRVMLYWHYLANTFFTFLTNILYNTCLTDMGTCYKVFRAEILKKITIKSNGFGLEPELTAKVSKMGVRIYETPISYYGRTYAEGKKIKLMDSLIYLSSLLRFRFFN